MFIFLPNWSVNTMDLWQIQFQQKMQTHPVYSAASDTMTCAFLHRKIISLIINNS